MYHNVEIPAQNNDLIEFKEINIQKKYKFDQELTSQKLKSNKESKRDNTFNQIFYKKSFKSNNSNESPRDKDSLFNVNKYGNKNIKNLNDSKINIYSGDDMLFQSDDEQGDIKEKRSNLKFGFLIKLIQVKLYSGKHFLFDDVIFIYLFIILLIIFII